MPRQSFPSLYSLYFFISSAVERCTVPAICHRQVLKGRMGAIRSLRFTNDGAFLAMSEPADFVHVSEIICLRWQSR